jgi:hypothetical protein
MSKGFAVFGAVCPFAPAAEATTDSNSKRRQSVRNPEDITDSMVSAAKQSPIRSRARLSD